jgi:hypothetical protein
MQPISQNGNGVTSAIVDGDWGGDEFFFLCRGATFSSL